jgi:hypothetical protein
MIPSQEENVVGVSYFESEQIRKSFNAIMTSINVIAKKQPRGCGRHSNESEKLEQIVKLTVKVADNGDRCLEDEIIGIALQDFNRFLAEPRQILGRDFHRRVSLERLRLAQFHEDPVEALDCVHD